jgi:arylsulfatase A-like enzyme/Flp pilus assembly protein TadD
VHPNRSTASVRLAKIALLCLLAFAGCHRSDGLIGAGKSPIILISIDTLRSDHLPAYGYKRIDTPGIDSLRADSILYERAYSHAPLTLVSHASLFTGELPAEHGIRDNIGYQLNPKSKTLAESMKAKGYATGAAVSAIVLRGDTGIKRGFDFYDEDVDFDPNVLTLGRAQRPGDATREVAQRWIGEHKAQPFFFFLHLYEPHTPYDPPEPFRSRYGKTYDGDVAAADAVVGRFLDYLRSEGLYDKATIILLSDHGEGLGEHGEDEHGIMLYRETLQVPLLVKLPGAKEKGRSVATPVELIDVFPTLADALGFPHQGEGQSLIAALNGKVDAQRPIYSETYYPRFHYGWSDLHSLISGSSHYIQAPKPELYDVVADPAETKNTLQENRRAYNTLRSAIAPYVKGAEAPKSIDQEQAQQLAALGYIGSTVSTANAPNLPDPKDHISFAGVFRQGFIAFQEQRYEDAHRIFTGLLRENPNMLDVWMIDMRSLAKMGRREEAIEAAKHGLHLSPTSTQLALAISNLSLELGRLDEAERHARLAVKDLPTEAHYALAQVYVARKDFAKAHEEAEISLGSKRDRPAALMLLGEIAKAEGKLDEALKYLDDGLRLCNEKKRPAPEHLQFSRGDVLARMGRGDEAEQAFRAEITAFPQNPAPYKNLILLYAVQGKTDAATQLIFDLEKASPTPLAYRSIAEALKSIGDVNGARYWAARGLQRFPKDPSLQAMFRG